MCGSSTVSSTSGPPPQFLAAYQDVLNQAKGVAAQPLQQYPIGPNASNIVAPLQPNQTSAINAITGLASQYPTDLTSAASYMNRAATPITPLSFGNVQALPGAGLAAINTAEMGNPANYAASVRSYESPYTQDVTDALRNMYNTQNATQLSQVRGNAAAQGAFGGDREAVAEALTAGQQQQAEAPVLAGVQQQGFTNAQQQMAQQQQLGLAAAQALLGEFNTQQQVGTQAQEATGWLNQGAGYGLEQMGNAGINALLQTGGLQQGQAQQVLNVPYEQFIQRQAYPFQTTGWLANIAEGLGGSAGGTASTTYPGPSPLSTALGLGTAGLGLAGQFGLFGGGGGAGDFAGVTGAGPAFMSAAGDFGGGGIPLAGDIPLAADGGRIRRAPGGLVPDLSLSIVPGAHGLGDAPPPGAGAGGLHKAFMQPDVTTTQSGGGGLMGVLGPALSIGKLFFAEGGEVEPATTPLQSPADILAEKIRRLEQLHSENFGPEPILGGGTAFQRITNRGAGSLADGGDANSASDWSWSKPKSAMAPDLSKGYVPVPLQAPARSSGPPQPPAAPAGTTGSDPVAAGLAVLKDVPKFKQLFGDNHSSNDPQNSALGGAVLPNPSGEVLQYDMGGPVPPQAMMMSGDPAAQRQATIGLVQQYMSMPTEKLREMAMRFPPSTPVGIAIQRAIQLKQMTGATGYPGGPSPSGPSGAAGTVIGGTTAARGGRMGLANGGDPQDDFLEPPAGDVVLPPGTALTPDDTGAPLQPPGSNLKSGLPPIAPAPLQPPQTPDDNGVPLPKTGGLAPGFSRSPTGELLRDGKPPDAYIGGQVPGGGSVPAWSEGEDTSPAGRQAAYDSVVGPRAASQPTASTGLAAPSTDAAATSASNMPWQQAWPIITHFESGNQNIPNNRYDRGHTASGFGQITDTNWHIYGPAVGVDIKQYPTAMSAPKWAQEVVGHAMFDADRARGGTGFSDWAPFNPRLASFLGTGRTAVPGGPDRMAGPGEQVTPANVNQPTGGGLADIDSLFARHEHEPTMFESKWMPLIALGAGILASRSPHPGVAIGEGLETALKVAGQQTTASNKQELADVRGQVAENQAKHMLDLAQNARDRLTETERSHAANEDLRGQNLTLSSERAAATATAAQARLELSQEAERRRAADSAARLAEQKRIHDSVINRPQPGMAMVDALMKDPNDPNPPKTIQDALGRIAQAKADPRAQAKLDLQMAAQARQWAAQDQRAFEMDPTNYGKVFNSQAAYEKHLADIRKSVGQMGAPAPAAQPAPRQAPATPGGGASIQPGPPGMRAGARTADGRVLYTDGKGWFYQDGMPYPTQPQQAAPGP